MARGHMLLVNDVMTTSVVPLEAGLTVREAAERLREANRLALPVLDGGRYAGLFTVDHLAARMAGSIDAATPVVQVAVSPIGACEVGLGLSEAAARMVAARTRYMPVMDEAGTCVGVITAQCFATVPEGRDWVEAILEGAESEQY